MAAFLDGLATAFDSVIQTTLQATVLAALILVLQRLLRKRLAPRWHYALWLLVLVRLFLPWTPESPTSVFNYVRTEQAAPTQLPLLNAEPDLVLLDSYLEIGAAPPFTNSLPPMRLDIPVIQLTWSDWLRFAWVGIAGILAIYVCTVNGLLWWRVRREPVIDDGAVATEFAACCQLMGVRARIRLVCTRYVSTPALLGLLRPRLLLPESMERALSREELRHVFLHELAHYRRGDLLVNWLMVACNIVHWFNPALWYAFHRMRADRELACDALAMSYIAPDETSSYGRTLLRLLEHVARPRPLPGLVGVLERKSHLKKRIRGIAGFKPGSYRWSILAVALIAILSAVALTNASTQENTAEIDAQQSAETVSTEHEGAVSATRPAPEPSHAPVVANPDDHPPDPPNPEPDPAEVRASIPDRPQKVYKHSIYCYVESVMSDANAELWDAIASSQSYEEFLTQINKVWPGKVPNVPVTLRGEGISREVTTNSYGLAGFAHVLPGTYEISARSVTFEASATAQVTIGEYTEESTVLLKLFPRTMASITSPVSLRGKITDVNGSPIGGAKVTGRKVFIATEFTGTIPPEFQDPPKEISTTSNADGTYELDGFEPSRLLDTAYYLMDFEAQGLLERVDIYVEAKGFTPIEGSTPRVPLLTETLLDSAFKLKKALMEMPRSALHPKVAAALEKGENPERPLPSSNGNTITGVDITLKRISNHAGTAKPSADETNVSDDAQVTTLPPSPEVLAKRESPISIEFDNEHIAAITSFLATYTGWTIDLDDEVVAPKGGSAANNASYTTNGMVPYVKLDNVPLQDALKAILRPLGLAYEVRGDTIYISTPDRLSAPQAGDDSKGRAKIEELTVSVSFKKGTTLMEAAAKLVDTADVNIVVDRRVVSPDDGTSSDPTDWIVQPKKYKDAPLINVLREILDPLDLTFSTQPGFIWISTPDRIATESFEELETRTYPVDQIPALNADDASRETFLATIRRMVRVAEPDTDEAISQVTLDDERGVLVVHSTPSHLEDLERFLLIDDPPPSPTEKNAAATIGDEPDWDSLPALSDSDRIQLGLPELATNIVPTLSEPMHMLRDSSAGTTVDPILQNTCEALLSDQEGAIVVLDAETGAVLAMAGSAADAADGGLNPAYQEAVPPGSLFKVVLAIAALEEGIITEETTYGCSGTFRLPGIRRPWRCWRHAYGGHGNINVVDALAYSCDVFFYNVGRDLGPEKIKEWAGRLGLGESTGFDLPDEATGLIPDPEWKKATALLSVKTDPWDAKWYPGETVNLSSGQGSVTATTLQYTVLMAAILNGGKRIRPYVKSGAPPPHSGQLVSDKTLRIVQTGLSKCVEKDRATKSDERIGTGKNAKVVWLSVLGKTGTAQVATLHSMQSFEKEENIPYELRDHALFIAGVMDRSPRIAVGVLVKHGLHGSSVAAPIARAVIEQFYGDNV